VPPTPGVLSALGFLYSDVKNEFAQTFVRTIDDADRSQIGDILTKLGRDARAWQREEGIEESRQRLNNEADVRYLRQGYEFRSKSTLTGWAAAGSKTRRTLWLGARAHLWLQARSTDRIGQSTRGRCGGSAKDQPAASGTVPILRPALLRLISMTAPSSAPATASAVQQSSLRWTQRP
jgi:hypothetical protein